MDALRRRVLDEAESYVITNMLQSVVDHGTGVPGYHGTWVPSQERNWPVGPSSGRSAR